MHYSFMQVLEKIQSWAVFYEKNNCLVINQLDCIQSYNDGLVSFSFFNEPSKIIEINRDFIQNSNPGFIKLNRQKNTTY